MAYSPWYRYWSFLLTSIFGGALIVSGQCGAAEQSIRVATFNVSMEASNYAGGDNNKLNLNTLKKELGSGKNQQIKNIAEILQRVRPDIVLLNEFDYIPEVNDGVAAFQRNYLTQAQQPDLQPINYRYFYLGPVNTGEPSPHDFNNDGVASGKGEDAWGYGHYPGQYGMVVLSNYPIDTSAVRSFRKFKWADMPEAIIPKDPASGKPWYSAKAWADFRLPSKAVWDLPVIVNGETLHVLASHPTPPVFDGPENRNGKRNHDEIRLLADYLSGADYLYDDQGKTAPMAGDRFVILGDLNASEHSEETIPGTLQQLFNNPKVNASFIPSSGGGAEHSAEDEYGRQHTAAWKSRADYVLPSKAGLTVVGGAVFWPSKSSPLYRLVASREDSSDHRLVYLDLNLVPLDKAP